MEHTKKLRIPRYSALTRYARMLKFGEIHTKIDPSSGLHAIIAVHNTKLGPAIGGCRFYPYPSAELALKDVLRLSYGMTLKAAGCGLPHGGAKAVIIKPKGDFDRAAIFRSFGDFIHELNGRYITAIDVGSTLDDMKIISERTPFVCSISPSGEIEEDPSISTARGVFRAIQAAVKFKFNRDHCNGLRVAIQGVGHVGFMLAKHLINDGAIVTVSDVHQPAVDRCVNALGVQSVSPDKIENIDCDIYSPCALGGTITHDFILQTKAVIIAGAANNQLAHHNNSLLMQDRGILYLPDFLINSGGLIHVAVTYGTKNDAIADEKVNHIYDATLTMLERAAMTGDTTTITAEKIALEKLRS